MEMPYLAAAATAERFMNDLHMERPRRPGGSAKGRLMWRSRTRTAGIRFEWVTRSIGPVLRVVATWTDALGHPRHTSFSVQCNGLEGALDRAIAARVSCGAPVPDRADLLQRLQKEFATAPQAQQAQQTPVNGEMDAALAGAMNGAMSGAMSLGSMAAAPAHA
jgi:hypothetical protein